MIPVRLLLDRFLRGRALMAVILYLLPFVALVGFGFVWLGEKGWLLAFLLVSIASIGTLRGATWLLFRASRRRAAAVAAAGEQSKPLVDANPDWTAAELAVFRRLSAHGAVRLIEPMQWRDLPKLCFEIVEQAAQELSGGSRRALDFSVPEALLLSDRVLTRLRGDLRAFVPFADLISIHNLWWAWRNREHLKTGFKVTKFGWRISRVVSAPLTGVLQEVQNMLIGGTSVALQAAGEAALQRLFIEEVARAAVDLHSGHLRFSDAELLQIELASGRTDVESRPDDDLPLRIVVVGQVSAGKTSLINALAGKDVGETDITPTTQSFVSHDLTLAGVDFTLVDSEGIDGSDEVSDRLLAQLLQADLVLWTVRANRPARAVDLALLRRLRTAWEADYRRRPPRVLVAITCVDQLLQGWPFPEHLLPADAVERIAAIASAVSTELGERIVFPLSSAVPLWNVAQLETLIGQEAGEALAVQRNRRRLDGAATQGIAAEARRAGQGVKQIGQLAWRVIWDRRPSSS